MLPSPSAHSRVHLCPTNPPHGLIRHRPNLHHHHRNSSSSSWLRLPRNLCSCPVCTTSASLPLSYSICVVCVGLEAEEGWGVVLERDKVRDHVSGAC